MQTDRQDNSPPCKLTAKNSFVCCIVAKTRFVRCILQAVHSHFFVFLHFFHFFNQSFSFFCGRDDLFLLFTCFCVRNWTFVDMMTFFFAVYLILRGNSDICVVMTFFCSWLDLARKIGHFLIFFHFLQIMSFSANCHYCFFRFLLMAGWTACILTRLENRLTAGSNKT